MFLGPINARENSKDVKMKSKWDYNNVKVPFFWLFYCSLKNCQDDLSRCQEILKDAKFEIQQWHSSFQNESFIPQGATPGPKFMISYLQTLRSSEESLREQLEKTKKKEVAFIVTFAKQEQEIVELKLDA